MNSHLHTKHELLNKAKVPDYGQSHMACWTKQTYHLDIHYR